MCLPLLGASPAGAVDLAYELNGGAGHSDNITREADNKIAEDIASAGLKFSLGQASPRLQADLLGDLAYYEYLNDTYDSELLGNFAGNVRFGLVPERFEWVIADNFGQVLDDPFSPATPDNRENINYLSTGPDVTFGLGARTRLRLGARYSLTDYQDTPFDSETTRGEIEASRLLGGETSISLNARAQQITYDRAELNADFDQNEVFLRYSATGARTFLNLDVGYTEIDRDAADEPESGLLLRLNVSRRVSASSTVDLAAGREFSSAGAAFASSQVGGGIGLDPAPGRQTVEPFTSDYVNLGWNFSRNRTGLSLYGSWTDQSYEDQPQLDQTLTSASASIRRDLSSTTSLLLDTLYSQSDFQQFDGDYTEVAGGATFSWQLSRSVSLNLSYDRIDRSSDRVLGDYTENRYWLYVGYGHGSVRSTVMRPQFGVDSTAPGI